MPIKLNMNGKQVGAQLRQNLEAQYGLMADASRSAIGEARDFVRQRGEADIAQAGNFSKRWFKSLQTVIDPSRGRTINIALNVFHLIPYAWVHEKGAIIRGKPLLWIPLPWANTRLRARDYARQKEKLFRVDREGKNPLLLGYNSKTPLYVGVESVKLKKRFHLRQIVREAGRRVPGWYRKALRNGRRRKRK